MWVIRHFEEALDDLFGRSLIRGTCHLCVGQEAAAVGACAALRPGDQVSSTHRGHGHFIAKGGDPKRVMAELFGKATGYAGGRGGSQHMAGWDVGFLGSNGITGGGIPVATGAALTAQTLGEDRVVVSFFGDGATAQGAFHEALNMGSLWKLPILYFCENNLYAMSTPLAQHSAVPSVADRAAAYGMPSVEIDGNDLLGVKAAVAGAAERARARGGPTLIDCRTYRFLGHSKSDKREYRTEEEEAQARQRDPILRFRDLLLTRDDITEADLNAADSEAKAIIEDAVEFAESSPEPEGDPTQSVYAG
jgi:pyruvate dehydrogenase E1 component alpha subunit